MSIYENIYRELCSLSQAITSTKVLDRNRSVDRLNELLTSNKNEIFYIMCSSKYNSDINWSTLFSAGIDSVLLHSQKLDRNIKGYQTSVNKNSIYSSLLHKIVESSYECAKSKGIAATTLYHGILRVIKCRICREYFGVMILHIIEETLFSENLSILTNLKLDEYVELMFSVFKLGAGNKRILDTSLKCSIKGIELGLKSFQCIHSFPQILDQIKSFTLRTENDEKTLDLVIRLNLLVLRAFAVDGHQKVLNYFKNTIESFCCFYKPLMRQVTKEIIFDIYVLFFDLYLPDMKSDDNLLIHDNDDSLDWKKICNKLFYVVEAEIKEKYYSINSNAERSKSFENFAVKVVYLKYILKELEIKSNFKQFDEFNGHPSKKITKNSIYLEDVLNIINVNNRLYHQPIWFTILVQFLYVERHLIDVTSVKLLLNIMIEFSNQNFDILDDIKNVRCLTQLILEIDIHFVNSEIVDELWSNYVIFVLNDFAQNQNDSQITEKQLLLRTLIKFGKVNFDACANLVKSFIETKNLLNKNNLEIMKEILVIHGTSIITKNYLDHIFHQLYTFKSDIGCCNDCKFLTCLGEVTVILILNNFENFNKNLLTAINEPEPTCFENKNSEIIEIILFKYVKKIIALESRKIRKEKNGKEELNKVNYLNEKDFECLLKNSDFQLVESCSLIDNLCKIQKLIMLIEIFSKFNIIGSNTEACLLRKKFGLLIQRVCCQIGTYTNHVIIQNGHSQIHSITKKLLHIIIKLKQILLYEYSDQYIIEFFNLLKRILDCLNHEIADWELEIMDIIKLDVFKSIAVMVEFNGFQNNCFEVLKKCNLLETNFIKNNVKNVETFLDILSYLIDQVEFSQQELPQWILEHLEIICKEHHNNMHISTKIIGCLFKICISFRKFPDYIVDIFIILSSFLKICYKSKFDCKFNAEVILLFKDIAKIYPDLILANEDIRHLYTKSIGKFFSNSSLRVKFSIVEFVSFLLDPTWFYETADISKEYIEFCQNLYKSINWQALLNDSSEENDMGLDNSLNINSSITQLFFALFGFSYVNGHIGFLELADFCKNNNLKQDFFKNRHLVQFAEYFKCDFENLAAESCEHFISFWLKQNFKLEELPWFLYYPTEMQFYEKNLKTIVFTALKTRKKYLFEISSKLNLKIEIILRKSLEKCYAFILPYSLNIITQGCDYITINSDYIQEVNNLLHNLKTYNINLRQISNTLDFHDIIYNLVKQFSDNIKFFNLTNFKTHFFDAEDFNFEILERTLSNLSNQNAKLSGFILTNPYDIVKLLEKLKSKIFKTSFLKEKLLWICRYLTIIDMLEIREIKNDSKWFFAKDTIYFISSMLKNFNDKIFIFKALLYFVGNFLKNFIIWSDQLEDEFFEVINQVIDIAENNKSNVANFNFCLCFLENIFCWIIESKNNLLNRLEPLMEREIFKGTSIEIHYQKLPSVTKKTISEDLDEFISNKTKNCHTILKLSLNIKRKREFFLTLLRNAEGKEYILKILDILVNIIVNCSEKEGKSAADCLGTIGPVFICKYAYLYKKKNEIYTQDLEIFEKSVIKSLRNVIFTYETNSYSAILSLVDVVARSEMFKAYVTSEKVFEPFLRKQKNLSCNEMVFIIQNEINFERILRDNANEPSYKNFLKRLSSEIFKGLKWREFESVAGECYEFDDQIILPLLKKLLENNHEFKNTIFQMLEYFYAEACDAIINSSLIRKNYLNKRTIKLMLDITELCRLQNNFDISVNLLNAAQVAVYQQAYFLAIFYLEMWALNERNKSSFAVSNNELIKNNLFQKIALYIYKAIDCKEAINGFINSVENQIEYYNNNNDWTDILVEWDASNSLENSKYLAEILKRNGLFTLSTTLQNKLDNENDYEIYWRLGSWNIPIPDVSVKIRNNSNLESLERHFEICHYAALKALKDKDETNTIRFTEIAKNVIIKILKETSIESMQNFYKHLTNLTLLRQIEEFSVIQFPSTGKYLDTSDMILSNWDLENNMRLGNFKSKERLMAQKIVLIELSGTRAQRKISEKYDGTNVIAKYVLNMVETCNSHRSSENINLTKRYLGKLKNILNVNEEIKCRIDLINADICIQNGRKQMGLEILRKVIKDVPTPSSVLYRIDANRLLGKYLAESNDETFDDIYNAYFDKTKNLLEKLETMIAKGSIKGIDMNKISDVRKNLYKNIAEYADREYQLLKSHIKSDDFQKSVEIMKKNRNDAQLIRENIDQTAPDYKTNFDCYHFLVGNSKMDANNIKYFEENCSKYLELALKYYIEFCKMDDTIHSSTIYRIIGLWFSNKNDKKINDIMQRSNIPSYKTVNVLSQLTAQLNSKESKFIEVLENIIIKCVLEYPQHTLTHIMCLDASNEDLQYFGHKKSKTIENDLRLQRVKQILEILRKDMKILEIINQVRQMFVNLIECAYWNTQKETTVKKPIRNYNLSEKLQKTKNLDNVHCPTVPLPIFLVSNQISNQEIISIRGWDTKYEPVGGINAPKKIYCNCSDGIRRPQLLKGNDDLRQDAIMLQVLQFVNKLLIQNQNNSDLSIRTYTVVPLSKRSGLIEWCTNTITLGNYLCGNNKLSGAHAKYRPNDKSVIECRDILKSCKTSTPEIRIKYFEEICKNIQPVLHYFFFERYKTPGEWFERRLAYMNSVATTSMIGYILGLGDRHCQNILLDEKTAEVIHIDFGIAFEKGKVMPTPETIPFRLTREIVSPMGICEVNGIFKNSCEQTLEILRQNYQILLVILEVLLYDPLYSWSVNEKIIKRINDESESLFRLEENNEDNTHNATAYRALMRIQQKLEGRTDRQIGSLSICRHVEKLIAEARNVKNLGLTFFGWDPYL